MYVAAILNSLTWPGLGCGTSGDGTARPQHLQPVEVTVLRGHNIYNQHYADGAGDASCQLEIGDDWQSGTRKWQPRLETQINVTTKLHGIAWFRWACASALPIYRICVWPGFSVP